MISVIVFTKGRPMQLHAYLESLLQYSDITEEQISILYCPMEGIRYDKVQTAFPKANWIIEASFQKDLLNAIQNSADYIMFGCDDVVFVEKFSVNKAIDYLKNNDMVLGYSIRLGNTILPCPLNLSKDEDVFEWDWTVSREPHYNYPWELDCTIYRKKDVLRLVEVEPTRILNPNYFEAMINEENRIERLPRPHLACSAGPSGAIVITVNRVQDTHPNGFDDCMSTDIFSLDRVYNEDNNRLDIERIAALSRNQIHVGSEYFLLKEKNKAYSDTQLRKKRRKEFLRKLSVLPRRVDRFWEKRRYLKGHYTHCLNIKSAFETMQLLEKEDFSFYRYGDGELAIIRGESIPFQQADAKLQKRLIELLQCREKSIKIGLPRYYFYPEKNLTDFVANFAYAQKKSRKQILKYAPLEREYIDTGLTQVYQTYQQYDFEKYFAMMQRILVKKDVTLVCGSGILKGIQYNPLEKCKSLHIIEGPNMNAFQEYDSLLERIKEESKDRLICLILGPTAKPLVYDLFCEGYTAWDLGHYIKDYDAYKKERPRTASEIERFYKPD